MSPISWSIFLLLCTPLFPAELDAVLKSAIGPKGIPAVVAMVATREKIVYQGAFGHASLNAVFRIFSMTKPVTSVAAMQLVERGRLKLDAPVSRYLPELSDVRILTGYDGEGHPILQRPRRQPTIRQLLSHTAGFGYRIWDDAFVKYPDPGDLLKEPLLFEPGTKWQYGVSTDVLGRVVERVSGQKLEEYFQQHIFSSLGMRDTTFFPGPALRARIVKKAVRQRDGTYIEEQVPVPPGITPAGGGGLFSTAADYVTFMQMFLRGGQGILRRETVESMRRNQIGVLNVRRMISNNPAVTRDFGFHIEAGDKFGLGFQINPVPYPNGRAANSMAWAGLWNTFFWIDPKSDLCAVVLIQSSPFFDEQAIRILKSSKRPFTATSNEVHAQYPNRPAPSVDRIASGVRTPIRMQQDFASKVRLSETDVSHLDEKTPAAVEVNRCRIAAESLEEENRRLKQLVADLSLNREDLKWVIEKRLEIAAQRGTVAAMYSQFSNISQRRACKMLSAARSSLARRETGLYPLRNV